MPSQLLQALPTSLEFPFGKGDTVLLCNSRTDGELQFLMVEHSMSSCFAVPIVAQVHVVFSFSKTKNNPLPPPLKGPLLFIQFFKVVDGPNNVTKMYKLQQGHFLRSGGQSHHATGIIPITTVTHAVELIPVYGHQHNCEATANVSLEVYNELYLNNYSDKEWYHTISDEYL